MNQNNTRDARFAGYTDKHGWEKEGAEFETVTGARTFLSAAASKWHVAADRIRIVERSELAESEQHKSGPRCGLDRNVRAPGPAALFSAPPVLWAGLMLAVAAGLCGCSGKPTGGDKTTHGTAVVPVSVAQAEARDVPVELRNIGNVEAYATVTVRSQLTGQIVKVHFQEGQEVKAGDLLFTIDPRPYEGMLRHALADLKRDEAQLVGARLEFERVKKLLEGSIASRDDYDKAEAAFRSLEATILGDQSAISNATLNVEFTAMRSRIDGRTGNLLVKEGNIVKAPDDSLVTINQVRPIYVTFSVPEQDLPAIRRRMREASLPVEVEVPGDVTKRERGELTFIDNAVDATTGRIKLKATFQNSDNSLWPGQFAQITLTLNTLTNAVIVPAQAIQSSQSGDFVFVVGSDSTVQKRPVVVGLSRGATTVVTSGVQGGETVVTDGQLRLVNGAKVSVPVKKQ